MGASYTRQSSYSDGDVIQASDTNNEFDQLLAAFVASSGHTHDGGAGEGGPITKMLGTSLTLGDGSDSDITVTFNTNANDGVLKWMEDEDYFEFSDDILIASTEKLQFRDTAIYINSSTDGQLDLVADTEIQLAATTVDLNGNLDVSGSLTLGGTAITSTAAELNILDGVTATASELNVLDGITSTVAELNILDGVTSTASELNLLDGSTAGTVVASKAVVADSNKDVSGFRNLSITGDLTVAGDDITMGTNTAGNLLVADGTNFNSLAVGDLSEISTVANDDVFLAVDTSGGGLKKITRSTIVSGLAVGGVALSNIVEDTTPQLGGNLDMNGQDIVTTSNADIELAANGTGHVVIKGNDNQGKITLNCESNSHGQSIQAQAHSLGITNVMLLPKDGDSTLVSEISTQTLTNKTLTSPKINENVAVTATATEINILDGVTSTTAELNILDGVTSTATELNILDGVTSTTAELNILDGVTSTASELNLVDGSSAGTIVNSKAVVYGSSGEVNATTLQIAGTSITSTATELNILDGVTSTTAELNILDGVTSTTAELNILDGVTSSTAELNILDGVTATTTELNYVDGVTSAIQTQLNAKAGKGFAVAMAIAL